MTANLTERQSNMELLRIISMLFILLLHSNHMGIAEIYNLPNRTEAYIRFFIEAISIIGVNCFILISGYFRIKLKIKNFCSLVFHIYFFAVLSIIIYGLIHNWGGESSIYIRCVFPLANYIWFIPCYMLLMLFSPILNSWLDQNSSRKIIVLIGIIYILTYIWSVVWKIDMGFGGYSFGFFLILYTIGHLLRRFKQSHIVVINKWYWFCGYMCCIACIILICIIQQKIPVFKSLLWSYNCPLILLESIFFFLFFASLKIGQNKYINWIARSCFAVLLVHVAPCSTYTQWLETADTYSTPVQILIYIGTLLFYYTIAILIDQCRIFLWAKILSLPRFNNNHNHIEKP